MLGHGTPGADRRTLCRSIYPALHIVRALSVNEIRLYAVYITFIYTQRWIIASDSRVAKVEPVVRRLAENTGLDNAIEITLHLGHSNADYFTLLVS